MKAIVKLSPKAKKDLRFLPRFILDKVEVWIMTIEKIGILETRKIKGFHDEPLKGNRSGQRSVRLNHKYRLFYILIEDKIQIINIIEINNHEY